MSSPIGVLLALGAAVAWGAADFGGGIAGRRRPIAVVLAWATLAGAVVATGGMLVSGEALPGRASVAWAASAGIAGVLGMAALFRGLSLGRSALVAPTAGVTGAALPVILELFAEGALPLGQQVGLVLALTGIGFVTMQPSRGGPTRPQGLGLALAAGIGFGMYFIFFARVDQEALLTCVAINRCAGLAVALALVALGRARTSSRITFSGLGLVVGVVDATGAVCYLLAVGLLRADVAAVLASFYPAITVLLYRAVADERVSEKQWLGLALCGIATALIVRA